MAKKNAPATTRTTAPAAAPTGRQHMGPFDEMERMFEGFFPRGWMQRRGRDWPSWSELAGAMEAKVPKVDIVDRDDDILVKAELPGVDKKDLDVTVSDNAVTIKGTTKQESREEKGDYYRCEIHQGSFSRTVTLPADVDGDKARASFKDGMLDLTLPKVAKAKKRSIKVE